MTKLHQLLRIVIALTTVSLGSIAVSSIPAEATAPTCSNVTISGTLAVGQTLTATPTCTNTPTSYAYQWSRSTTTSGTFTDITGATASTRLLTNEDLAYFLRVTVLATNASGTSAARTSPSTSTAIYLGLEDFAGSSTAGYTDATGTSALFSSPRGIAVDASGNLYVTDNGNNRIRKISTSGVVTTFAGSGTSAFTDGTGTSASFSSLRQITYSPADDSLFVLDGGRIREVAVSTGVVTTLHNRQNIAFASRSSTTRTLKFSSAHGYRTGDSVTVAGVNADFDGTFSVSVSTNTQLTYMTTGSGNIAEFAVNDGTTTAQFGSDDGNLYGAYYNAFIVGPDNNLYHARTNAGDSNTQSWLIRFVRVSSNNFRFERVKWGLICSMSFKSSTYLVGNSCGTHVRYTTATANDWTNYTSSTLQSSVNDQVFYASDDYFYSAAFRYTTPASGTATQTRVFASSPGTFWAEQGGFLYVISGNTIRRVFGFTADTTAPTITTYSPSSGSTTASISTNLVVTFSENVTAVAGKYVRICTGTASCTGSTVSGDVVQVLEATNAAITISTTQVTINPASDLSPSTTYYVSIDSGAFRDAAGNDFAGLSAGASWNFTTAVAAPAFTISSSSESVPQGTTINGYTVSSTGGTIASFSISPAAPTGLSFNTSTGLLSGTPTVTQSATTYTITATNAGGTATRSFTLTVTVSCANGGECSVGDVGPGGGVVFYVHAAGGTFTASGAPCDTACRYLEAAPTAGANAWTDAGYAWSGNTTTLIGVAAQGTGIGAGFANTEAIVTQAGGGDTASRAATISRAYRGPNTKTDWYLPARDELNELCKYANTDSNGLGFNCIAGTQRAGFDFVSPYWNSTETNATDAQRRLFSNGGVGGSAKSGSNLVRPIRAFGLPAITYDGNGGSGSIAPITSVAGTTVTLSSGAGLSRGGFSLNGWNTASAGGGTPYATSQSVTVPAGGLTLYAQWTADSPTTTTTTTVPPTTTVPTTTTTTTTTSTTTTTTSTVPTVTTTTSTTTSSSTTTVRRSTTTTRATTTTTAVARTTTTSTIPPVASATTTTLATTTVTTTTTPIYERPDDGAVAATSTTLVPPTTVPARAADGPEPGVVSQDDEVEVLIQGVDNNDAPSALNPEGRLVLTVGNFVRVRGKGFTNAGFAEVWIFSTPQLLGRVPKNEQGEFVGRVRVPSGLAAGEHTVELRAKTRRGRSILMSVPAIVFGGAANPEVVDAEPQVIDVVDTTIADLSLDDTNTDVTSILIEIAPGATEVAVPIAVITQVVARVIPANIKPAETKVEVRTNVIDWQSVDLESLEPVVLPLNNETRGIDVQATAADGRVFGGSIPVATRNNDEQLLMFGLISMLGVGIFVLWFVARRKRRDDDR